MKWYKLSEKKPPLNTLVLIYVPKRTWLSPVKPCICITTAWRDKDRFRHFGPDSYTYDEVESWCFVEMPKERSLNYNELREQERKKT